jgi:hypothetical protein
MHTVALSGLWMAAVLGATLIGLTAVGAIGNGIVPSGPQPLTQVEIDARLAATPSTSGPASAAPAGIASDPTAAGGAATPPARVIAAGPAGTVVADCTDGTPRVLGVSPAQGFQAREKDDDSGPKITFESDQLKVEARLSCTNDIPTAEIKQEQDN